VTATAILNSNVTTSVVESELIHEDVTDNVTPNTATEIVQDVGVDVKVKTLKTESVNKQFGVHEQTVNTVAASSNNNDCSSLNPDACFKKNIDDKNDCTCFVSFVSFRFV